MGEILDVPSNLLEEIICNPAIIVEVLFRIYGPVVFPFVLKGFTRKNFGVSIYYTFMIFIAHFRYTKRKNDPLLLY